MNNLGIALTAAAGNGTAATNPDAWDLSKFFPVTTAAWDISQAEYGTENQKVFGANPRGLVFKPDGTKIYTVDSSSDEIREFSAPQPWSSRDLTENYAYVTTSQQNSPAALYIKPDGTKVYLTGFGQDAVHEYDLSTAWDLSTIAYNNKTVSISSEETNATGLFFKTDGTKMYVCGISGDDINEYDLSTAWDVSTASYSQRFSVSAQDTAPRDVHFKSDGLTMYITGDTGNTIDEYSLSTAWDVSTASYSQSKGVGSYETVPASVAFKPDGSMMFVTGTSGDDITEYIIAPMEFNVNSQQTTAEGVFFKTDGTKMYTIGATSDAIHEYNLSTAWDLTTASYSSNSLSLSSYDGNPTGMYWKSDGTQFWVSGASGDAIDDFTCSTAWDITTASYSQTFSVSAQETDVQDVHFKSDGTKMYICGTVGDDVNEYDLSTAWDISTASYSQNFQVGTGTIGLLYQVLNPSGLFFKPDGTKMYISGYGNIINEKITEFELSTPWDISTASVSHYRNIRIATGSTQGIYFKPDGTSLFIVGEERNKVIRFDV
jgi:DNA-binding beta-propeller fold protein YncE